jgi:hypothetical protein
MQINLGIGTLEPAITTALTPDLRNTTGNGTLCIPKLTIPAGLAKEGDNATLQVVTFDSMGAALYNVSLPPVSCVNKKWSQTTS